MEGKLLWKQDLGRVDAGWFYDPDYQWGAASSPDHLQGPGHRPGRPAGGLVHRRLPPEGRRARPGARARDEIPSWGTPTVYEGPPRAELVTHATKFIRAYDPLTGKELWRLGPNSEITAPDAVRRPRPDLHHQRLPRRSSRSTPSGRAARGDLTLQGRGAKSSAFVAWSKKRGGPYMPTPIVYGDHSTPAPTTASCRPTRRAPASRSTRSGCAGKGGAFTASPVAADGKLYFPARTGTSSWSRPAASPSCWPPTRWARS